MEKDTSSWKPTQGASGDVTMEFGDWRAQMQRQRIVNKIMDTLKRHLPFSGYERLQELEKIAERVEEEIYTAATSQSEYSRKICFMMLTIETRLQAPVSDPMWSSSAALYNSVNPSVPLDLKENVGDWQEEVYQKIKVMKHLYLLESTARNPNGEDWQEEVYQKIKAMKDLYLLDLKYMHQKILYKLQQQPENEQLEKLKVFKNMLERFMRFLQISKHGILANYKDKLGTYEKQIINVINSNRRKPAAPQQQAQALPPPHMQSLQQSQQSHSQLTQVQSYGNQMNLQSSMTQMLQSNKTPIQPQNQQSSANLLPTQVQQSQPGQLQQQQMIPHMQSQPGQLQEQVGMQQQPNLLQRDMQQRLPTTGGFLLQNVIDQQKQLFQQQRAMPEASSTLLDSTAQTGNPDGVDWQEEVYQKIKAMKDLYLPDLIDMHQKILSKLQQHDSLRQQPENVQLEKLKVFKNMLERFMQFLQIPKHGILANYKDKLATYERQIINVINSNRQKPGATQQQSQP